MHVDVTAGAAKIGQMARILAMKAVNRGGMRRTACSGARQLQC